MLSHKSGETFEVKMTGPPGDWMELTPAGLKMFSASLIDDGVQEGYQDDVLYLLNKDFEIKGRGKIIEMGKRLQTQKNGAATFLDRALAYAQKGEVDPALEDLDKALELSPDNPVALTARGILYNKKGQYDSAIKNLDKAIQLDPNNSLAFECRGDAYVRKGQYDHAIEDLDRAVRLDPDNAVAFGIRGFAFIKKS